MAYRLAKTGRISCGMAALSLGLFCCTADDSAVQQPSGALVLKLTADTAGVKTGSITTKALTEFDGFLDEKEYRVQVYQGADTLQSALYKDFPEKIELKEGDYVLRAFKGANLPAAFSNPYFEGTKEFAIKEGMKTPLDVTCTLANTRLFITYTDDFRQVYTDCTVSLRTSYTGDVFLVPQTESRSVYLQSDKTGTDLEVAVTLKRASWTEAKTYTVTNPSIALKPQESVNLVLSTDGKTGDGLALSVVLDDRMEELELEEGIPDFMWKPFDKPTVEANGFVSGEKIEILKSSLLTAPYVAFGMPAGVGALHLWRTIEGSADTLKLDLAKPEDMETARQAGFTLVQPVDNLSGYTGANGILLARGINLLEPTPGDKPYEFMFFAEDNLPVKNYTDTLHLFVQIVPGVPVITFTSPFPENGVVEGDALEQPVVADLVADGELEDVIVAFSDGATENTYRLSDGNLSELGASLDINEKNTKATLTLPASFTESLDAEAAADKAYTMTVTVHAKRGLEDGKTATESSEVKVLVPRFSLAMSANEGDVFAKRAILRADLPVGNPAKLKFQKQKGGAWVDVDASARRIMEGTAVQVDTLKGLNPVSGYTIRAVYDSGRSVKESDEYSFTTENVGTLPNGNMEEWYITSTKKWSIGIPGNITYYCYYPIKNDQEKAWWVTNNSRSMDWPVAPVYATTCPAVSYVKDTHSGERAAEIRTTAGSGYAHTGSVMYEDGIIRGMLFIGNYNWDGSNETITTGHEFTTRPSKLSFWYKYQPFNTDEFKAYIEVQHRNDDEITVLASGQFTKSSSSADNEYQQAFVSLDYKYDHISLKATHIYVQFISTTADKPQAQKGASVDLADATNGWKAHIGSRLKIDDVELIYE